MRITCRGLCDVAGERRSRTTGMSHSRC